MVKGKAAKIYHVTEKAKYMLAVLKCERKENPDYDKLLQIYPDAKEEQILKCNHCKNKPICKFYPVRTHICDIKR